MLGRVFGIDGIREDLKKRVDEIIKAGDEWNKTAKRLADVQESLVRAIETHSPLELGDVKTGTKNLWKETKRLSKAHEDLSKTLVTVGHTLEKV